MKIPFSNLLAKAVLTTLFLLSKSFAGRSQNADSLTLQAALRGEKRVNLPLFQSKYTADPAPLVVGDTLFLYTSHDASPEDIPDPNERSSAGFFMYDWLLWSTTDMVNWTEHGAVASLKDFPWRSRENGAWAIQTVERDGKFYLYAPLHGHGIGVLVSDSPYGPFHDPLGKPLVWQREHWDDIDPSVFIDDDGQAYMYWGNPHTYYARLNDDMISLKDSIVRLDYHIDNYQEGPWIYKRGGRYYLAYASTCCPEAIGYATSGLPTGPWQSRGYIMRPTPRTRGNHPGICDFRGHSYVFGQNYDLMHLETFVHHERRSVSVSEITYNADGTIREIPYWLDQEPLRQLHWLNPYQRVEAETMAWGYGLKTAKMGIMNTGVVADMPESSGRRNMYVYDINEGEYIRLRGVDFGRGANLFSIAAAATGSLTVTLRLDGKDGPVLGNVAIGNTGSVDLYRIFSAKVAGAKGVHDLYLCFGKSSGDVHLDWWQFTPGKAQKRAEGGRFEVKAVAPNAVRIKYMEGEPADPLPEWVYVKDGEVRNSRISVKVDQQNGRVEVKDPKGKVVFTATRHQLMSSSLAGEPTSEATLSFVSPKDEYLFGLGQFQDGYSNVRGLSRRLTQVNTQISIPMLISSKGYGVLWNNYGLVDFNPCEQSIALERLQGAGHREEVNVTSTNGGRREVRERHRFGATLEIGEEGDYALLLDVGQKMARRHNLSIDGVTIIDMQNLWLPPTTSEIVHLTKGEHQLTAELSNGDKPVLYFGRVKDETTFRSPVADAVDYTVFVGTPDEIIASYRELTGPAPKMPKWALGYIHCRERFHSSDEILATANRFRQECLPLSLIVQDWQYWGKYGWNAMRFDENFYPDPKALTDSLHRMDVRLMVSVWSKIDKRSEVGSQMRDRGYFIPGTDWVDFFNPDAAAAYWENFSERLVPLGIDAWWQDATEPENDDLAGRRVNNGRWLGERVRNVYPLMVNKTVGEGLVQAGKSPVILTRSGFPGIQRYGAALWSGDVGNDWETLRRQLTAGLGVQAAGIPWWTYDAGGFFRPVDQYTNPDYIERMLRWIETSVYLPLMRVHGYMSNTEPWNYGPEAQTIIAECLRERERLLPYIDSCAVAVSDQGYTLMRPLVFDFADDPQALQQKYEYMFGPKLLISPVTEPNVTEWRTYLPRNARGWTDRWTGHRYEGGRVVTTAVDKGHIPVFVRN